MRLIDADKLNLWTALRPYCSSDVCCEVTDIIDNAPTVNPYEWISVEERLPHWSDGKVLVFTKYGFSICERTVNSRWQGQHANWITYWMPLPEPPTKGGE